MEELATEQHKEIKDSHETLLVNIKHELLKNIENKLKILHEDQSAMILLDNFHYLSSKLVNIKIMNDIPLERSCLVVQKRLVKRVKAVGRSERDNGLVLID